MATVRIVRDSIPHFGHYIDELDLPPPLPHKDPNHQFIVLKNLRHSRCDISTGAIESEYSIRNRELKEQLRKQSSIAELHRKIARKASSLGLRIKKGRLADAGDLQQPLPIHPAFARDLQEGYFCSNTVDTPSDVEKSPELPRLSLSGSFYSTSACSNTTAVFISSPKSLESSVDSEQEDEEKSPQQREQETQQKLRACAILNLSWPIMSNETAAPPVPYERLKNIATSACDTALSHITSYSHSQTETWNTTIINTILTHLVEETTPHPATSNQPTAQPQFKYVVNSTIIQHASASSNASVEDGIRASGRRGMHSASGAYWNNEKDGMWSFKYEAAEAKGLDVVVGIIWVWVG